MWKLLFLGIVFLSLWALPGEALEIRYLGHSAFFLSFESGFRCVLDPFSPEVGYSIPKSLEAHALISTHEHFDHLFEGFLGKHLTTLVGTKSKGADWNLFEETIEGVHIFALPSYHDEKKGTLRGKNAIIVLEGDTMRLAHLGDIGALPEREVKEKLQNVDILFVPTGGHYTLSLDLVVKLIQELTPRVVIPMHYRTEATKDWPIAPLEEFLKRAKTWKVTEKDSPLRIRKENLPETTEIWVMQPWTE
ncbi:MAG: MBL fold metallo-hydrolase [Atribacterota bacterium]